jgi:hypothetical protein
MMKLRPLWLAIPACALVAASCKKEEASTSAPAPSAAESGKATAEVPSETPAATLSAEERAAKFGIVKHLPKDTESLFTVYNGSKVADRLKKTQLWKVIQDESGGMLADDEEIEGEESSSGVGALLGREVFIATGKGSSDQLGHLLQLNRRASYFQGKMLAGLLALAAAGESDSEASAELGSEIPLELLKDPESGIALLDKASMPPLYVGFKTAEADREEVAQQVASIVGYLQMAGEQFIEPVEFESAGGKFNGYRILGEALAAEMEQNREGMDGEIGEETAGQLIAAIAKKKLVIASGTVGEYVVFFMGTSESDCQLVSDPKDSFAASQELGFADAYADKELMVLAYNADPFVKQLTGDADGARDVIIGFRDGIAKADGIGETRDIQAMLQLVADRCTALEKLATGDTMGIVSFFEEGLKIETFGGTDSGALDWKAPNRLGDLGKADDVAFFANFTSDAAYDEKAMDFAESLVETSYAIAKQFSGNPQLAENQDFAQFQQGFAIFDTSFRGDVVNMINAIRGDFADGVGKEAAIVVDTKGAVPTVPGLPQEVVDQGKFFRASWITPVVDRSKIQSSWTKINDSTTNVLKTVSEMGIGEFPMQKPISTEKDGFTTWFFPMPFFNDDFMPSVTVSDKWFVASTSKTHAIELGTAADASTSTGTGLTITVNFDPIRKFGSDWLTLVDQHSDKLFGNNESGLEEFNENKVQIEKGLKAIEEWEKFDVTLRRDGGRLRGSVHFKTR